MNDSDRRLDFGLTNDQIALRSVAREVAQDVYEPKAIDWDMAERLHRDAHGWAIAGGTTNMQRVRIASEFLGRRFDQRR